MTRHVPIGGTHPDLFLVGPGDMEVLLLTSIGPSISATTESLHINLGETTHPQWTFQGLLSCVGQFILKGRMSILFSLWLWLKQWCWFWRCLSFLSDVCSQAAEQRRNVECFSSFQKLAWTPHPFLLGLLSICSISEVFYPSLTLMGPNSLGSVLFIYPPEDLSHSGSVQIYSSVSYLLRTASRHVKDFFGTPTRQPLCLTRAFQNLPQSSTFLQILYHWACWKRKKTSRNWPLLIRLTKKVFPCVILSPCMRLFSLALCFTYKLWEAETVILICIFQCLAQ